MFFELIGKIRWLSWPLIGWDIFDFSSETTKRNSTKLDRKQDLNVPLPSLYFSSQPQKQDGYPGFWLAVTFSTSPLKPLNGIHRNLTGSKISTSSTKFVFFPANRKNKMAALASDWLRHFQLLLWNHWTEFNENLTGSKISTSSTKLVFFQPTAKTRWLPWPLIGWDIFNFSSETTERNSTKLDRKQDLNVLYQVCIFPANRKNKMAALASDWLRHFRIFLWSQRPLPSLCFSGR